mmetsp:Transcript_16410/g.39264  ORF Transcript_16410/g.39264 Transcript_16410/m.39264 type:complete len:246 (-) Transcript_16410:244-981(-)|eukprot:CAMPEP_0181078592 /NCGR_PEP_ID=MMETSP1071-20121207/1569_1 /TAXON_ID=35127 /ORGANISM="Thalassiosira sp., Strain NH16" /LENGTH=245 /DNA_ID=CAMNT_0023159919 /DNA_START=99 /DNA_END=836 /DNA_ORIENTATION=+
MKKVALLLALGVTSASAFAFSPQAASSVGTRWRSTSSRVVPPPLRKSPSALVSAASTRALMTTRLHAASMDPDDEIATIHRNADATFAVIDVDGGGTLSRAEFTNHLSASGYNTETIDKIFNKMDVNKDQEISREEFRDGMLLLAALQTAPGLGSYNAEFAKEICEDADQVFSSADADGNGEIDRDELRSHIGRSFANYSEGAIDEIFRQIDVNDDGTITKEEFQAAFLKSSALRQAIGEGPNYK